MFKTNENYPYKVASPKTRQTFLGVLFNRNLSHLNLSYKVYIELKQRLLINEYLKNTELANDDESAKKMGIENSLLDYSMN